MVNFDDDDMHLDIARRIVAVIGIVESEPRKEKSPKFKKRVQCESCWRIVDKLYQFKHAWLCLKCFEEARSRFPKVKT